MTLFGDQAEVEVERAVELIEQCIDALGVDPARSRLESADGHRWTLQRGSAAIVVAIFPPTDARPEGILRIVAPVVRMPAEAHQRALFARLLELNADTLAGCAFGLKDGDVVLVAERSVRDLDASEVERMLTSVGREADRHDDRLAQAFHTTRCCDPPPG